MHRTIYLIAFLLILGIPSFGHKASAGPRILERLEASVNSMLILKSDLSKFRETMAFRAQLDPLFAGTHLASQGASAPDGEIVSFMVNEKLIAQQFNVTDAEVEQEINSIQANNKIDRATLREALKEQGVAFDDYFELIRMSAAKRNLIDRDIRTKVTISDDDVKNYYFNRFARESAAPIEYRIRILTVSPSNYKSTSAARDAIQRALKEIQAGEAFEEVAKRVSDDPSAPSGGDLGALREDQIAPSIRAQLKKLQIGQVSEIFSAPTGAFVLLKLVDAKSVEGDQFEKMKEEIRNQLVASEYQHQIALWLERQRQNAFIHRAGEPSVPGLAPPASPVVTPPPTQ